MEIPSSASIKEFAFGFKDIMNKIQADNISFYGSDSEEDQQPIDLPMGQILVLVIEPILPPALLYSYPIESLKKQLLRLPPCYLLLGLN